MTSQTERESNAATTHEAGQRPRPFSVLITLVLCAALAAAGFIALGTWQVKRLHWKHALIERVEQRIHATPVSAPDRRRWPAIAAETDEYRRVMVSGTLLYSSSALVQASTELGSGFWMLTPLSNSDGTLVLVNLGFLPANAAQATRQYLRSRKPNDCEAGRRSDCRPTVITGLLRISEPHGGFLRSNGPAGDRWYSRDVAVIAAARELNDVAPYFIDLQVAEPHIANTLDGLPVAPVGGLTVVAFHDNHLVYALTWYALALMMIGSALWLVYDERKQHRRTGAHASYRDRNNQHGSPN
ncbi:SURF1 family protein [Herbaspirillum sp. GCM10030257]|uniref:SURF1 family protein n=1 Tax=Herbaspirillum sp. GCM10030257 TaxID=3273393 RepID=UPI00361D2733